MLGQGAYVGIRPMATDGSHGNDSADAETARTEGLDREVNERANEVNAQRELLDLPEDLICECAQPECSELIALIAVEYRVCARTAPGS
jgi:hypothetical protein